jgi:hypothetical protein
MAARIIGKVSAEKLKLGSSSNPAKSSGSINGRLVNVHPIKDFAAAMMSSGCGTKASSNTLAKGTAQ